MGAAAGLARRLRAALQEEEPRAVEELLRRGADPNMVLVDGAAAIHLAARARYPRGLCCLRALLHRGGDPNARSAEALTPLHVAAAWGCLGGLTLLLSQGADPALRDQDGFRPLDLAVQQGHMDCARVLRQLDTQTRFRTWTEAETQEPEPEPGRPSGPPHVTLDSTALQTQLGRDDGNDMGLEAGLGSPNLPAALETTNKDRSSVFPLGSQDCSSDASFITAIEVSGAEDLALNTSPWTGSVPQTRQRLLVGVCPTQGAPKSPGAPQLARGAITACKEAELNAHLQALTLMSSDSASFPSSSTSLLDGSLAHSPQRTPLPRPCDLHIQTDDQASLDSDVATLWLTEDEASFTGNRDPVHSYWHLPVPTLSDLELPQGTRALRESPGLIMPFALRQLEDSQEAPGPDFSGHSPELAEALRTGRIPHVQADEDALVQQFEQLDPARKWREGVTKSSFTYLLIDPRETQDLPARAFLLTPAQCLQTFVRAIFYVGKGTRARPYVHFREALRHRGRSRKQDCPKVCRILDIWASGCGVISLHCFQHVVAVEAYTREACLVDALGIQMLTNQKQGHYYGVVASWPPTRRRRLGVHLLHRALLVFLAEGERELRPQDIQGHG
ncbi:ankyrin repeat and LEM domain-containing protein 1 [Nycticebus coucang]|uniref:ankyrin repeat and LEM domain-containing protein 1 n=1 Tax=Nycticebus coucang TaxID=9470 RepID=UPI00234CE820|nr:ankyrin repeat and LEM domain-containing protein 1 [Nycticebus coucang]